MDMLTLGTILVAMSMLLVAGVLLAFSDFTLQGFSELSSKKAIEAMQAVNRTVLRSFFLTLLMANVALAPLLAFIYIGKFGFSDSLPVILAATLYVVGVFVVTGVRNVPLNERLRVATPSDEASAKQIWQAYVKPWKMWNTMRVVTSSLAAFCLLVAALGRGLG